MEFRQLEAFVNAAKYKSFSKAADATFLTQPTISTHVSNLENELGVRLLNRSGREISLTPHGHEFYSYAVELLNTRSRAVMSMKNLKEDLDGILEIQTSSIPGYFYLPQVMEEFHELFPRVKFYVEQSDSRLVNENLMNQRGELGFNGQMMAARETAACALSLCSMTRWYSSLPTRTYTGSTRMERPSRWSCSSTSPSLCGRTDREPGRRWKRPWFMGSLCLKTWM